MRPVPELCLLGALALTGALRAEYVAYRAVGALDSATAATVVHCAHLGAGSAAVTVRFLNASGGVACTSSLAVAAGETRTFTTRDTLLFTESAFCAPAPAIAWGRLEVALADGSSQLIACTAQVAALGSLPAFAEKLPLYNGAWQPFDHVVFASGFERGSTADWSATTP